MFPRPRTSETVISSARHWNANQHGYLLKKPVPPNEANSTMAARLDGMMEHCSNGDVDPSDIFRTQAYHMAFHMRMAECTGSPTLRDAIEKNRVLVFNWLYDVAAHVHLPPRWHQNLMDVVAEHDPEAAEAAMRQHIRRGLEEIQAAITSQFVERFEPTRPLKDFPPTRLKRT